MSDTHPQNDPDRAGGLITDAQGEFVQAEPGGPFDPRAFQAATSPATPRDPEPDSPRAEPGPPPVDDERMSSPGAEIDKAG